jgi:hypothetical protein
LYTTPREIHDRVARRRHFTTSSGVCSSERAPDELRLSPERETSFSCEARAGALVGCFLLGSCQVVSSLNKYEKVDCVNCTDGAPGDAQSETGPSCGHTFCASFDQSTNFLAGWKTFAKSQGATLDLDTVNFRSPPASVLISVPQSAGGFSVTKLAQSFTNALKGAHLELDARFGPVSFPDAGAVDQTWPASTSPPPDTWVHLRFDVTFSDTGAGTVKLEVDGSVVVDQTGLTIVGSGSPSSALELGLSGAGVTPAFRANYDNITLDLDP